jgi:hypothetical protein
MGRSKLRLINCAHDDPPQFEDACPGSAAAGVTGSAAGSRMPGGPHGSLGAECAEPHEVPVAPPRCAGATDVATPGSPLAAATTRARRRACGAKTP